MFPVVQSRQSYVADYDRGTTQIMRYTSVTSIATIIYSSDARAITAGEKFWRKASFVISFVQLVSHAACDQPVLTNLTQWPEFRLRLLAH